MTVLQFITVFTELAVIFTSGDIKYIAIHNVIHSNTPLSLVLTFLIVEFHSMLLFNESAYFCVHSCSFFFGYIDFCYFNALTTSWPLGGSEGHEITRLKQEDKISFNGTFCD